MLKLLVIFVGLILIGIGALILIGRNNINLSKLIANPTPTVVGQITPTAAATTSPTPPSETLQGEVVEVSKEPVGFMNSILVTIKDKETTTNIYLTEETQILGLENQEIKREDVKKGDNLLVKGYPIEGGIEAAQVAVIRFNMTPTVTP